MMTNLDFGAQSFGMILKSSLEILFLLETK